MWRSSIESGAPQLLSFTEIAPKTQFLCVNGGRPIPGMVSVPPPPVGARPVVPLRSETSAPHVYASFSQPWYKKVRYACTYLLLSATDQMKAVRELTQHVRETTSQVGEYDVGETTRRRNDRRPLTPTQTSLEFPILLGVSGHLATKPSRHQRNRLQPLFRTLIHERKFLNRYYILYFKEMTGGCETFLPVFWSLKSCQRLHSLNLYIYLYYSLHYQEHKTFDPGIVN